MVGTPILTTLRQSTWHHHLSILTFHNIEQLFTPVTNNNRQRTRRCTCTAQSGENQQCSTSNHQKREPSTISTFHIRKPHPNSVFPDKPANGNPIIGDNGQRHPPPSSPTVDAVLDTDPLLSVSFSLERELQVKFQEENILLEGLSEDSINARVLVDKQQAFKDKCIAVVKGEEGAARGDDVSVCNSDETLTEASGHLKERDREAVGGGRRKHQVSSRKGMEKERGYRSKRGMEALTAFLRRPEHLDFRSFDLAQFVSWLENVVAQRMSTDRMFQQRDRISGIIREHLEEHTALQGALDAAREAYARAPTSITLRQMEQDLQRCRAATSGLRQFLAGAPSSSSSPEELKQSPGSSEPLSSGLAEPGFGKEVEGGGGGEGGEMSKEDLEAEMEINAKDAAQAGRLLRLLLREVSAQGGEGGEVTEGRGMEEERNLKKVKAAERKLVRLELMLPELERTYERLCQSTPEWRVLREAEVALDAFDRRLGVTDLRGGLQALGKQRGQSTLSSGRNFEDVCTSLLEDMLPSLARSLPKPPNRSLEILSNVTLGMAMGEIDKMVVVPSEILGGECEVVALLECKQNVNDLGPSFSNYQAFLGWLTRDEESYMPSAWTTKKYPKGHFDRAATHVEGQRTYSIGPSSFQHFQRSPLSGHFLRGLMFAVNSTHGGTLTGLDSRALNSIASKIAGDVSFRPGLEAREEGYLTGLLEWAKRSYRSPYSTADVLRFYTENDETAEHILFVDIDNGGGGR